MTDSSNTPPPEPAPMPSGDAFIDAYFNQALISPESKGDDRPVEHR